MMLKNIRKQIGDILYGASLKFNGTHYTTFEDLLDDTAEGVELFIPQENPKIKNDWVGLINKKADVVSSADMTPKEKNWVKDDNPSWNGLISMINTTSAICISMIEIKPLTKINLKHMDLEFFIYDTITDVFTPIRSTFIPAGDSVSVELEFADSELWLYNPLELVVVGDSIHLCGYHISGELYRNETDIIMKPEIVEQVTPIAFNAYVKAGKCLLLDSWRDGTGKNGKSSSYVVRFEYKWVINEIDYTSYLYRYFEPDALNLSDLELTAIGLKMWVDLNPSIAHIKNKLTISVIRE